MDVDVDCIVAGAGVVGLAVARSLAQRGLDVLVLERADQIGTETSSRNSEVIHAGIYYATGSLKHSLCVRGKAMLYNYCAAKKIAHAQVGKLIVATMPDDLVKLAHYERLAGANGVAIERISGQAAREMEPELRCIEALWSPSTGIVDSHGFMLSLLADIELAGGSLVYRARVSGVAPTGTGIVVTTEDSTITCRSFVNSAGLEAQSVAAATLGIAPTSIPPAQYVIGHYYALVGRSPFSHLIYPTPGEGSLGIHVTLDLEGRTRFGPDARWIDRVDYRFDDSRREAFLRSIADYYPGVRDRQVTPGYTGIRPVLVGHGEPAGDFAVSDAQDHGVPGVINLFGIESPGLTAALALGEYVSARVADD